MTLLKKIKKKHTENKTEKKKILDKLWRGKQKVEIYKFYLVLDLEDYSLLIVRLKLSVGVWCGRE